MASESTEEEAIVTVPLPADLDDWLDGHAEELGVDRETVMLQVLASYRATRRLDGDGDAPEAVKRAAADLDATVGKRVDERVREQVDERLDAALDDERLDAALDDRVEQHVTERVEEQIEARMNEQVSAAVDDRLGEGIENAVTEQAGEATAAVRTQLGDRIDAVEAEFQEKIEDVRERVIQVKQEADAKAPADHGHAEFERLGEFEAELEAIDGEVDSLREQVTATTSEREMTVEELEDQLATVRERLQRVAWVTSDLRDAVDADGKGLEAVERIKRAAAKADVDRARCENCSAGVDIALMTEPTCPHCDATVTDIRDANGFFNKPRLLVASQLESGEAQ